MQFHLDGFAPGDPEPERPLRPTRPDPDVLIVGAGPTGLTLAAQLAQFPEISVRLVERKPGPLELGQADGIACRTMEMFQAFGFADRVLRESYFVNEVTFWKPEADGRIVRHARVQDVEDGLSEFPHVILNQARVHDFFLERMRRAPAPLAPEFSTQLEALTLAPGAARPVTATLVREGARETASARYIVGCDGARSAVRAAMGLSLMGEAANQAWGVMDLLAVTDFPDTRFKCAIQSAGEGNALIIPREGGYLFRIYIELDKLGAEARVSSLNLTAEKLIAAAQRILRPYTLDVKEVVWWSAYEIGQRLTDAYDDVTAGEARAPCAFIAGDACHTHSPKAGQGMNVSMQDAFNLGWKLAAVLRGHADPSLLSTYSRERRAVAQELIDFDREWAQMFSARARGEAEAEGVDPVAFQRYFVKQLRFTAGVETHYAPSPVCGGAAHQALARGFPVGRRFHSAPVVRLADARRVELGHCGEADGRWRLYAFADAEAVALRGLCDFLERSDRSPIRRFTRPGEDVDSLFDLRAVFQQGHRNVAWESCPPLLRPRKGRYGLVDSEKAFAVDLRGPDIFEARGVDRRGALVGVRPDQYVALALPLDAYDALANFFEGFMRPA